MDGLIRRTWHGVGSLWLVGVVGLGILLNAFFAPQISHAEDSPGVPATDDYVYVEIPFEEPSGDWYDLRDPNAPREGPRALSYFVATEDDRQLDAYIDRSNGEIVIDRIQGLDCDAGVCSGYVPLGEPELYTVYAIGQDYSDFDQCIRNADIGWEETERCAQQVGCEATQTGELNWSVVCPVIVLDAVADFSVDPDDYWDESSSSDVGPSNPAETPPPPDSPDSDHGEQVDESPVASADSKRWNQAIPAEEETVFSRLPLLGPPDDALQKLAVSTGVAVVFIVAVLLPTQLINSVLEVHGAAIRAGLAARVRRVFRGRAASGPRPVSMWQRWLRALIVFLLASVIVGLVEPGFGLNAMSVRLMVTALLSFLVINFVAIVLVWLLFRKKGAVGMPHLEVHYSYLFIIATTVLVSRFLELEPVVVFGVVLVIEAGRVVAQSARELVELPGRLAFVSSVLTVGLGLATYAGYVWARGAFESGTLVKVALTEFFAIVTIEALATLPVLLLPLTFLPGRDLFRWSKPRWFGSFLVAVALFIFLLVPLPESWASAEVSLLSWSAVLAGYTVFAVGLWAFFATREPREMKTQRPVPDDSRTTAGAVSSGAPLASSTNADQPSQQG